VKLRALSAVFWAAFSITVAAEEGRWQVTAHVDIFQLPEKNALEIIPRLLNDEDASNALHLLTERAAAADSDIRSVAALMARTLDGPSALDRSGEERRFPIEYEQEDFRIGVPMDAPVKLPDATGYPTTTFQTRECGARMEFSAKVHPSGEPMLVLCSVEHLLSDRWTRYETAVRGDGMKLFVEQPEFIRRKSSNSVLTTHGKPILLGTYRMAEKEGTFELHVLTAFARRLNLDGIKAPRPAPLTDDMKALLPAVFPKRDVRLELLTFSVSPREAVAFRRQLLDESEASQALTALVAQSGSDEVKLIDWQTIPSVAGGRAVTENVREFRYGINDIPTPRSFPDVQPYSPYSGLAWLWQGEPCMEPPTTFETRNLGTFLEVECELKGSPHSSGFEGAANALPGTYDRMQFRTSNVTLSNFLRLGAGPNRNGKASYIYQPQFTTRAFATRVAIENGKPALVRFAKEPGASNRFEIAVLRAHDRQP
jgi:hypothetical protein